MRSFVERITDALQPFGEAQNELARAMERSARATEDSGLEWWRWKLQFLASATDEEAAEAARLFGWD